MTSNEDENIFQLKFNENEFILAEKMKVMKILLLLILFSIYIFCLVTLHKQAKQHLLSQNFLIERIRISFYRIAYRDWIKSFLIVYGAESLADLNHKLNGLRQ